MVIHIIFVLMLFVLILLVFHFILEELDIVINKTNKKIQKKLLEARQLLDRKVNKK